MNRIDTAWAKKANPVAFKAQEQRDLMDIKMLEKKKAGRELAANLWLSDKKRPNKGGDIAVASPTSGSDISMNMVGAKTEHVGSMVRFADET